MHLLKNALLCCFLIANTVLSAQDYRYTNTQFSTVVTTTDVLYGTAPALDAPYTVESSTTTVDLLLDLYLPVGDTHTNRPVLIFIHGGAFTVGNKTHDDMVAFCNYYAKKGYVTASISYRKGFNVAGNTNMHGTRAVYRGIQDGRAAVRYFRAHASSYGIDPNQVYMVGSSAGAFVALHALYMDESSEKPSEAGSVDYVNTTTPFNHTAPDLGLVDAGDYLSYIGKPNGVIALWGALQHTDLITENNNEPVFLVHGESDAIVPFAVGYPFSMPLFNDVYGSQPIAQRITDLGLTNLETYFVPGEGHEFYGVLNGTWTNGVGGNDYWDIIVDKSTHFTWLQHKPTSDFTATSTSGTAMQFTDSSTGAISWHWNFGDGTTSTLQNPSHTYSTDGTYTVTLYIENELLSWDETTQEVITGSTAGLTDTEIVGFSYFPNPTTDKLELVFNSIQENSFLQLFSATGQLLQEKRVQQTTQAQLSLLKFPKGVYYVRVYSDGKTREFSVIKQ